MILRQSSERLHNEFETLKLIAAKTTIPVPKVLEFKYAWGAYQLVMERVEGITLDQLKGSRRAEAVAMTENFIATAVIPQLQSLKSFTTGTITGTVIPPDRIASYDDREKWPIQSARTPRYTFCHNDLAQHNILIDPDTLRVKAIIDWEVSGFYKPDFEAPLWTKAWYEPGYDEIGCESRQDQVHFLADRSAHDLLA